MIKSENFVSAFNPLYTETMKQEHIAQNKQRNNCETKSLKALALQVLERNKRRNNSETKDIKPVSLLKQTETSADDCIEFYEERAAISEFDGGLSRPEAEKLAIDRVMTKFNHIPLSLEELKFKLAPPHG